MNGSPTAPGKSQYGKRECKFAVEWQSKDGALNSMQL
jgi:hypothetical protein